MEKTVGKGILYDDQCHQICEVEYEKINNSIHLRMLQPADGPVAMRAYLLPEGKTYPFRVNVFPVPNSMQSRANCTIIGQPRHHDQGRNTRAHPRFPVDLTCTVCGGEETEAVVQNLSEGGLMLFSDVDLEVGQSFQLQLQLRSIRLPVKLEVRSKIPVGLQDGGSTLGYGCMFVDQSPVTHIALKRYLTRCQAEPC